MNLEIVVEDGALRFINRDENDYEDDWIEVDHLDELRDGKSEWVLQLSDRIGYSLDILYRLGQKIQELAPNNQIDWHATYFPLEKSEYLISQHSNDQMDTQQLDSKISQTVKRKLKEYKIL